MTDPLIGPSSLLSLPDLLLHLYALLNSFRKYEMEALEGCQILMACEAGARARDGKEAEDHPKYGRVTKEVHQILR